MLSCGKVFTRHGPFCNRPTSLAKDGHLQKRVSLIINKRLFESHAPGFSYEKTALQKCLVETNVFDNRIINMRSIRYLSTRKFHTNLLLSRSINADDRIRTTDTKKSNLKIDIKGLVEKQPNIKNYFENNEENNTDNVETNVKDHNVHESLHHSKREKFSIKDIEKMYPNPKSKLHEIYQLVNNDMNKNTLSFEFKKPKAKQISWSCTVRVLWPEDTSFVGLANNKNKSAYLASLKCLHWLENCKKLNKGMPVLYDAKGIKNLLLRPVLLSVKSEVLNDARLVIDKYNNDIKALVDANTDKPFIESPGFRDDEIVDPVGKVNPLNREPKRIKERNEILKIRYEKRMEDGGYCDLPILEFREKIINEIKNNQVLLIKGDTGCGKTTQVPQFIMDSFAESGAASDCNIIVSQPRRISAISLSERVANERKEQLGDVIGYQVRLSQELPNTPAGILFCTAGILLRKLQFNPTLRGCSHVIVDEAHERTINTDMLLVLLKRAMKSNPALKVIVMSATINAELFQNYFNCNVIEVPGRTFPVTMNFMDDIDKLGLRAPSRWDLSFEDPEKMQEGPTIDIVKMGELISWITRVKPPGAILCFLPGWSEIAALKKYLEEYSLLPKREILVLPVHSKIAQRDQKKIFDTPPSHIRKIVLATDIAETGITVTDVVYVVDSCTHRQIRWHEKRGISSIDSYWISKANVQQRKGRAGRVKPGFSYHMITRKQYENLSPYPTPEVMRSSLEKTVLDIKTYCNEKAVNFLGSMPQPPSQNVVKIAVRDLINLGALDNEENLTALGKRIAMFTVHPTLSKSMVFSSIFQCVAPTLSVVSVMSSESEIFTGVLQQKGAIRAIKEKYHPTSDHISLAWLFEQWNLFNQQGRFASRDFCLQNRLYPDRMYTLSRIRQLNADHLAQVHMLHSTENIDNLSVKENEYAELDELVRGVLLAGLDQILYHRDFDLRKGQVKKGVCTFVMEDNNRATLTPDSVNFKRRYFPSPYLTYVRRTHSEERRTSLIRETSMISPLTVFLFSQGTINGHLDDDDNVIFTVDGRRNIRLVCDKETADVLLAFRDTMWSIVRYMVENYGLIKNKNSDSFDQVQAYKVEMLQVLAKMLSEASMHIDNPQPLKKHVEISEEDNEEDCGGDDDDDDIKYNNKNKKNYKK
ncbi:ATP-dependent RNA helicase DHX30 [Microplitis demolitor]|uniref:ATP-dependent RNA helicase DHX30 n=1 Tax=Microplitis demolitor TaxID=69319 RepID=UPI0004CCDD52|nr:ATP-dependent RNA helicase DHX30 [Microplitis demolitor]XP_008559481.1 ATP-dependent RNA helicase DHX30 [Microplitis demolitor]